MPFNLLKLGLYSTSILVLSSANPNIIFLKLLTKLCPYALIYCLYFLVMWVLTLESVGIFPYCTWSHLCPTESKIKLFRCPKWLWSSLIFISVNVWLAIFFLIFLFFTQIHSYQKVVHSKVRPLDRLLIVSHFINTYDELSLEIWMKALADKILLLIASKSGHSLNAT
jgi:hypothetical protein